MNFQYRANISQIRKLAQQSEIARQTINFNCKNTVAYYNLDEKEAGKEYSMSVRLMSFNDKIMTGSGGKNKKGMLKYDIDQNDDGCMVSSYKQTCFCEAS